ncbi:MAG: ATP-binding protein [Myxococcota bacterium]
MSDRLLTLDFGVVALYLLVTLIVGIVKGRGVKTMEHFAIGHKERYGTAILVATLFATEKGGGAVLVLAADAFRVGLIDVITYSPGIFLNHLITARFIAPYVGRFRGMISAGDMMESFYGRPAKFLTGVAGMLFSLGVLALQVGSICYLCEHFFGFSRLTGAIIGAELVVLYSCFGGAKSVTYTDVIQFCALVVALPLVSIIGVHTLGGTEAFLDKLPSEKLKLFPQTAEDAEYVYLFVFYCFPFLVPATIQRLLMARDARQGVEAFKKTAFIGVPINLCVACIGLIAFCLAPSLKSDLAFLHVMDTILPGGVKGLAIVALLAVVMSTADSNLNAASICLAHDVIKPLWPSLSDKNELRLAQLTGLILGNLAIIVVLNLDSLYNLKTFAYMFWNPMILMPFIIGVMGIQASSRSFLLAAGTGLTTALLWKSGWVQGQGLLRSALVPSTMLSAAVLLIARCFDPPEKRGHFDNPFAGTSPLSPKKLIDRYVWTPAKHLRFSREQEQFYGIPYTESVAAAAAIQLLPYAHIDPEAPHFFWLLGLRVAALLLCTLMGLRAYLPLGFVRRYLAAYWMAVMPYAALVVPTFALFCGGGAPEDFAFVCVGGLMVTNIVHPGTVLRLIGGCAVLGWLPYRLLGGTHGWLNVAAGVGPLLLLTAALGFVIVWRFSRSRETITRGALASSQLRERVAAHESKRPLAHCRDAAAPLREDMEELVRAHKKHAPADPEFTPKTPARYNMLENAVRDIQEHSQEGIAFLKELIDKVKDPLNIAAKCEIFKASECVALALSYGNFSKDVRGRLTVDTSRDYELYGNKFFWAQLVVNVVENAGQHTGPDDWIRLWLKPPRKHDTFGKLCCRNSGKVIPTAQLPHVFDENFSRREGGSGTGTAYCDSVAQASDGESHVFSDPNEGTTTFEFWTPRVTQEMRQEAARRQEQERKHLKLMQEALRLAEERSRQRDAEERKRMLDERYGKLGSKQISRG